jgi:universal stress protein A
MTPSHSGHEPSPAGPPGKFAPWVHRIMVPIDFSEACWAALKHALPIARLTGAKITLLNVCQAQLYATEFAHLPSEELSMGKACEKKLRASAKGRIPADLAAEIIIRHGVAYDEIVKAAQELDIDLIVINTRGHTGLKHALLGSTTERVVRYAPCPVLVIRERGGGVA